MSPENIAVAGRRFVRAADCSQHNFLGPLLQSLPSAVDGSQTAGHCEALCGHQYLRTRNGPANTCAELGRMEAGVTPHALRDLCGGSISAWHVGVASRHRTTAR